MEKKSQKFKNIIFQVCLASGFVHKTSSPASIAEIFNNKPTETLRIILCLGDNELSLDSKQFGLFLKEKDSFTIKEFVEYCFKEIRQGLSK